MTLGETACVLPVSMPFVMMDGVYDNFLCRLGAEYRQRWIGNQPNLFQNRGLITIVLFRS